MLCVYELVLFGSGSVLKGIEFSGVVNSREFLEQLDTYVLLLKQRQTSGLPKNICGRSNFCLQKYLYKE
jgi:hypothetical protein